MKNGHEPTLQQSNGNQATLQRVAKNREKTIATFKVIGIVQPTKRRDSVVVEANDQAEAQHKAVAIMRGYGEPAFDIACVLDDQGRMVDEQENGAWPGSSDCMEVTIAMSPRERRYQASVMRRLASSAVAEARKKNSEAIAVAERSAAKLASVIDAAPCYPPSLCLV